MEETWEHFLNCSGYRKDWEHVFQETTAQLNNLIIKHIPKERMKVSSISLSHVIIGNNLNSDTFRKFKMMAAKAKVPQEALNILRNKTSASLDLYHNILAKILMQFINSFR